MSNASKTSPPPMASDRTRSTDRCQTHTAPLPISASPSMQAHKPSIKGMRCTVEAYRSNWNKHPAYPLMANHTHLLVETPDGHWSRDVWNSTKVNSNTLFLLSYVLLNTVS